MLKGFICLFTRFQRHWGQFSIGDNLQSNILPNGLLASYPNLSNESVMKNWRTDSHKVVLNPTQNCCSKKYCQNMFVRTKALAIIWMKTFFNQYICLSFSMYCVSIYQPCNTNCNMFSWCHMPQCNKYCCNYKKESEQ